MQNLRGRWLSQIGGDGSLLDLFDRDVVFCGGGAAVFKLGGYVALLSVERADLYADVAVGRGDVGVVSASTATTSPSPHPTATSA